MNSISLNLLVIRSSDIEKSCTFYTALGLQFSKEKHGDGPEHYACVLGSTVVEIYPRKNMSGKLPGVSAMFGFRVPSIESAIESIKKLGAEMVVSPHETTSSGQYAVLRDPDGHRVHISE